MWRETDDPERERWEMRIKWYGHSCFEAHNENVTILMDPHDGRSIGIKPPVARADIVLISHDHFDHNCVRIIKGDPTVIREPGERSIKGITFLGIPTWHDNDNGIKRGKNIVFKMELDGISIVHCGDLGHSLTQEQVNALSHVDILIIPAGGILTIDYPQINDLIKRLAPRVVIPMHYHTAGLSIPINNEEKFLSCMPPGSITMVGNEIDFTKDELPIGMECWVFSL